MFFSHFDPNIPTSYCKLPVFLQADVGGWSLITVRLLTRWFCCSGGPFPDVVLVKRLTSGQIQFLYEQLLVFLRRSVGTFRFCSLFIHVSEKHQTFHRRSTLVGTSAPGRLFKEFMVQICLCVLLRPALSAAAVLIQSSAAAAWSVTCWSCELLLLLLLITH